MHCLRSHNFASKCRLLPRTSSFLVRGGGRRLEELTRPRVRRRRLFSDWKSDEVVSSPSIQHRSPSGKQSLEQYTSKVLQSRTVPLGTMTGDEMDDVLASLSWTNQGDIDGYAIHNAERLIERLDYELLVASTTTPDSKIWMEKVADMRRILLQGWWKLHEQHPTSILALDRAQKLIWRMEKIDSINDSISIPETETFKLIDGYLCLQTREGTLRASQILLSSTSDNRFHHFRDHISELGFRFDKTILNSLSLCDPATANALSTRLLDRVNLLKNDYHIPDLSISESTLNALQDAAFQKLLDESPDSDDAMDGPTDKSLGMPAKLSKFEAEEMQMRMAQMIQKAENGDEENISKIIQRVEAMEFVSEDLIRSLVDYFLRLENASNAHTWITKLPTPSIASTGASNDGGLSLLDRLMDVWTLKLHPQAPWRADDLVRQVVEDGDNSNSIATSTINRLLQLWSTSSDPAASRKIREWFFLMIGKLNLKPDPASILLVLNAMDKNTGPMSEILDPIVKDWQSFHKDEKQAIATLLMDKFSEVNELSDGSLKILANFERDGLSLPRDRYLPLLQRAVAKVDANLVATTLEQLNSEPGHCGLILYEAAIYSLITRPGNHLELATNVWKSALELIVKSKEITYSVDVSTFLTSVVKMFKSRKLYSFGEAFLVGAEQALFPLASKRDGKSTSPIPLEAYKLILVRNWYRPETAKNIIRLFQRLESLYEEGYRNLRPDQEMYLAYLKATAIASDDWADIERILEEMICLYEETKDSARKPPVEAFNVVLFQIKNKISDPRVVKTMSLDLWNRLLGLDVIPDTKTINFIMHSVIKDNHSKRATATKYSNVMELYKYFEKFQLEPDAHTYHFVLTSCRTAKKDEQEEALATCLRVFGAIRKKGFTTVASYVLLTKALSHLLRNQPKSVADKVATSTLLLCCDDGLLAPEVKQAYESITSDEMWNQIYTQRVSSDNQEPEAWHRNLPNATNVTVS